MDFNEQVLERDAQRYVVSILNFFIIFLQNLVPLVVKFSSNYPRLFLYLTIIIFLYIVWSLLINLIKLIKKLFYLYLIVLIITIHLRGWEQFFMFDLPLIYSQFLVGINFFLSTIWWIRFVKIIYPIFILSNILTLVYFIKLVQEYICMYIIFAFCKLIPYPLLFE